MVIWIIQVARRVKRKIQQVTKREMIFLWSENDENFLRNYGGERESKSFIIFIIVALVVYMTIFYNRK